MCNIKCNITFYQHRAISPDVTLLQCIPRAQFDRTFDQIVFLYHTIVKRTAAAELSSRADPPGLVSDAPD